jgi:type II secretory pathway component GspD/PulD (secretin)
VLGFPFKHTVKSEVKTELLIFLTPYIIRNDQGLEDETNDETGRTELIHKAFSERELDQYLQGVKVAPNVHTRISTDPNHAPTQVQKTEVRRATVVSRATPKPKNKGQQ